MTYAPDDLLAIQRYCRDQTGQPWASLGIVGDTSHNSSGGYHVGRDVLHRLGRAPEDPGSDYSYVESQRDRNGLTDAASAFDLGGGFGRFREVTLGLVAACQRGDARTRDIREVIYTPDGRTVRRWDRLGIRNSGDSSHLSHTHLSFFRDSDGRRANADNVLGLLKELFEGTQPATAQAHTVGEIDMARLLLTDNVLDALAAGPSPAVTAPAKLRISLHWGTTCKVWVYIQGIEAREWTVYGKDAYLERDLPPGTNFAVKLLSTVEARIETDPPTHAVVAVVPQG